MPVILCVFYLVGCQMPSMPSPSSMPSAPSGGSSAPSAPSAPSGSDGTSVDDLDQTLDDTLGDFDDDMSTQNSGSSDEIDILSPQGNRTLEQDQSMDGSDGDMSTSDSSIEQRAEQGAPESSSSADGAEGEASDSQSSASTNSSSDEQPKVELPEDIGDGQGDDIVLRQIREAALNERDPVLREKLWEEYRRIKNQ